MNLASLAKLSLRLCGQFFSKASAFFPKPAFRQKYDVMV